jgi:hypothetical protein
VAGTGIEARLRGSSDSAVAVGSIEFKSNGSSAEVKSTFSIIYFAKSHAGPKKRVNRQQSVGDNTSLALVGCGFTRQIANSRASKRNIEIPPSIHSSTIKK